METESSVDLGESLKNRPYIDQQCAPIFGFPFVNYSPEETVEDLAPSKNNMDRLWGTFAKSIITQKIES